MTRHSHIKTARGGLLLAVPVMIIVTVFVAGNATARTWIDASGKHKIDAEFIKLADGVVQLRRPDKSVVKLPLKKLSKADQEHVRQLTMPKETTPPEPIPPPPPANTGDSDPSSARFQIVVAEGLGRKKEDAIQAALKSAVRQAVGVLVTPENLVDHNDKIETAVISESAEFVQKHSKLGESRADGFYRVRIKVRIIQSDVVAELKTAGIPLLPVDLQNQFSSVAKLDLGDEVALDKELESNPYAIRNAGQRARALKRGGGNRKTEKAVLSGLKWLARHQNRDGSWSFNHTKKDRCSGFPYPGHVKSKMSATGLSLLAFLGAGHTHKEKGEFRKTVRAGLGYLISNMKPSGLLFGDSGESSIQMYCHAIAACAVVEAYGMSADKKLEAPAQLAIDYIVKAQDPDGGGWRYQPGQPGDTSVLGWQIMALRSAEMAKLTIPKQVYTKAMNFLDSVRIDTGAGLAYYLYMPEKPNGDPAAKITMALLSRIYMGWDRHDVELKTSVWFCVQTGLRDDDMYFNYHAAMLMFQTDGPHGEGWTKWNTAMQKMLLEAQDTDEDPHVDGSWLLPKRGIHLTVRAGGRLCHTAMATMMLENYYRYPRVFDKK